MRTRFVWGEGGHAGDAAVIPTADEEPSMITILLIILLVLLLTGGGIGIRRRGR